MMAAIDGKALLYDDLVERLAELEAENECLRALSQRLTDRLAGQHSVGGARALEDVIADIAGERV